MADLVARYLRDAELAALVDGTPGRERLTVATAAALFGDEPGKGWPEGCVRSFPVWRAQASEVADHPALPVHPDAHMHNYVLADGRPYLIDWDGVDVSDVVRDVGVQVWGSCRTAGGTSSCPGSGLRPSAELDAAVYWWSAFKMLRTALWVDDGAFHGRLFQHAVARQDWIAG